MTGYWLDLPLKKQGVDTSYCVPYSIRNVAEYYGIDISNQKLIKMMDANKKYGTCIHDCVDAIKEIGLKFERIQFKYENVMKCLKQGIPIAVSYQCGNDESHFAIISGAFRNNRGIRFYTLNDTYYGEYHIPIEILKVLMKKDGLLNHQTKSWARKIVKI